MKMGFKMSALAICVLAASGCATKNMSRVEETQKEVKVGGQDLVERARAVAPANPFFSKQPTFWVERTPLPMNLDPSAQLPPIFKAETVFNEQTSVPLSEILARLNKTHGLLFTVAQDVYEADPSRVGTNLTKLSSADSTSSAPARAGGGMPGGVPILGLPGGATASYLNMPSAANAGGSGRVDVIIPDLIYKGPLASLLDIIATKSNLAWKYDGERVHFFRYDTKVFRIEALAGGAKTTSRVGSSASAQAGGDSGGGSVTTSQETSMDTFADIWADVSTSVQAMLSGRGKMSLLPSTGQVTVTDTPDQLRRIEGYVRELNKDLGKQVSFNVDVYSVEVSRDNNFGMSWDTIWSTLASKYSISYSNQGGTANARGLVGINVLNGAFAGSKTIFGALSSLGNTSLVTSTSLTTLNYIPVPVAVTRETAYLKEQSTTVTGTTGTAQTSLRPGKITTGFSMNLTPRISNTDKMQIQFSMDLSDLIDIATFSAPDGSASIQLPQRNVRNFLQRVSMRSGQTLILSGFQQTRADSQKDGVVHPNNWLLGGKREANGSNTTLVVVITPYVMN